MDENTINIRLMKAEDFDAVVAIDEKVLKTSRVEYYETRFERLFKSRDFLPTSLVAEDENSKVVGFVMGVLYMGEYGIHREGATLDTIGVDPDCQRMGIGKKLIDEFLDHLKSLGVSKIKPWSTGMNPNWYISSARTNSALPNRLTWNEPFDILKDGV